MRYLTFLSVLLASSTVHATLWDQGGADNDYNTPENWAGDTVPVATFVEVKDATDVVDITSDSSGGRMFLENNPTINVTGGNSSFGGGSMGIRSATFNHSGGTININQSGALPFGSDGFASTHSTYNLSGGSVNVNGAGQTTSITNVFGTSIVTGQASGNLDISMAIGTSGGGTGDINVSGTGELRTRVGVALAPNSSFTVSGSNAHIGIGENNTFAGSWYQAADATLTFEIDTDVSTIDINRGTNKSLFTKHVAFEDGALLDLSFLGSEPTSTTTYTLISFEDGDIKDDQAGLGGTGLEFVDGFDATDWTISVDNTGANGMLLATFTAIPEPGSFAFFGIVGLAIYAKQSSTRRASRSVA